MMEPHQPSEIKADPMSDQRAKARVILQTLSSRQREVLEVAARVGKITLKEIARELPGNDISDNMVSRHLKNAQKKLGADSRDAATAKYLVLDGLANPEKYEESNLFSNPRIVEKLLSDLSGESAPEVLLTPEFQDFLADIRSKGPKGKTAKYGPWWKVADGAKWIAIIMLTMFAGLKVTEWLNDVFAP